MRQKNIFSLTRTLSVQSNIKSSFCHVTENSLQSSKNPCPGTENPLCVMRKTILFSHTKKKKKRKKVIPVMKQKILFLSRDTEKNNAQHTAYRLLVPTWGRIDEGVVWLVYSHVAQRMKYDSHTRCALLDLACCTCMQSP